MAGIFAMATALLTPEFVENFDPEKLASKFVRVEREFGVKFNKLNSSFVIVGNWQSIRDARISLLKLITDENEGNPQNGKEPETNISETVDSNEIARASAKLKENHGIVKTAGNPRRGRHAAKDKKYANVPEPVFFLQYQDQTFSTAESLDINSVLDDFEKSHYNKAVKKEDLKKIFEKNKDQMGKPLERGIPKGAIIPVPKTAEKAHDVVSGSTPNSSNYNGSDHLNLQFLMNSQVFTTLSSPVVSASTSNSNLSSGNVEMINSQFSSFHSSRSDGTNYVNSLPVLNEQSMNSVSASMLVPVASPRIDSQSFCPMFENYDPQSFLNVPVSMSMGLSSSTMGNTNHNDLTNPLKNTVPSQQSENDMERLSIFATDQNELQLYSSNQTSRTDQQMELAKLDEMIGNPSNNMNSKHYTSMLNESMQSSISDCHNNSSNVQQNGQTVHHGSFNSFNNDCNGLSRSEITHTGGVFSKSDISGSQVSTGSSLTSTSSINTENVCPVNTSKHGSGQWETTQGEVNISDINSQQADKKSQFPNSEREQTHINDTQPTAVNRVNSNSYTGEVDECKGTGDKDVSPLKNNFGSVNDGKPDAKIVPRKSVKGKRPTVSSETSFVKNKPKKVRTSTKKNSVDKRSKVHPDIKIGTGANCDPVDKLKETEDETKNTSESSPANFRSEEHMYKCTECDYQGHKKKRLSEHMGRVHGILIDGKAAQNSSFLCDLCEKTFVFEKDLNRHKKIVHHGQIFTCQLCYKSYKSKYVYDRHLATHAAGYIQPKFKCQICEREFTTKFSLSSHVKSEHLGVKKTYCCPICSKTFSQIRSYRQHANVHAGIRPYTCEFCGKSFTYDKSLKEHRYMHDTIRRFPCSVCGKAFRQQTCLLIHMKTHKEKKDHICSVCGREFTQKQSLLRHERIHTGDKPYTCKICQKSFGDHAVIRKHVMMAHKRSKESWKDEIFTEPKEKSSHYIEGGPGYMPREYSTKVQIKNDAAVIPTSHPGRIVNNGQSGSVATGEMVIDGQSGSVTSDNNVCNAVSSVSGEHAKSSTSNDMEQVTQDQLNNFQTLYHMPSFSQSVDLGTLNSSKPKSDSYIMEPLNTYSIETNSGMEQYNIAGLSDQNTVISDSIFSNIVRKMSSVNDEAYAAQFLNLPVTSNKVSLLQTSEHNMNFQAAVSESVAGNGGPTSNSTVAVTTNNSWNYAGYPSSFYSPASFNQYQPSPEN